ncbi:hypothetical protein DPMN_138617 [Dreissena polymorpha]|uniref:Uncharacterized protein n=1 Tax=Dreissena polymorpha TaxID=45954 RepID=A0A9D4JIR2_DREPO|nr:hypothetical protein DPMN_138617 [Dreissena polymorpha]
MVQANALLKDQVAELRLKADGAYLYIRCNYHQVTEIPEGDQKDSGNIVVEQTRPKSL